MESLARTAIRLDPYDANGHILLAWALGTLGKNAEALAETNRALELNPSSADILNTAADSMSFLGKPEEGAADVRPLVPAEPDAARLVLFGLRRQLLFHRPATGGDRGGQPRRRLRPSPRPRCWSGRLRARRSSARPKPPRQTIADLQKLYWEVSFEWLLNTGWNFERTKEQEQILASSRKAGLRICATADELADFSAPKRLPECTSGGTG